MATEKAITREIIAQRAIAIMRRLLNCTPKELQQVLDTIHSWKDDFGDKNVGRVKTVQEIINLLAQPEYIKEAEKVKLETGEDYFNVVFNIKNMEVAVIRATRDGYSIEQVVKKAMTVKELIAELHQFDEESHVVISNDNGYTYGPIRPCDIYSDWTEKENTDGE